MESVVNLVQEKLISKNEFPTFSSGDTITVYYEIREGDKVRTQSFKGVVIQIKGRGESKTFTIRKMSGTVGVERIFPLNMPALNKIEVLLSIFENEFESNCSIEIFELEKGVYKTPSNSTSTFRESSILKGIELIFLMFSIISLSSRV